ncbi:MAG: tetratricopeptide repeat protein [Caulobacteraceae bacterium]|nr:tetratricopeptide repeat protein [Caulobacteraceae bacterium]
MLLTLALGDPALAGGQDESRTGRSALDNNAYAEAIAHFDRALEDPSLADAERAGIYLLRGRANIGLGQLAQAVADETQALTLDPGLAPALTERAMAHLRLGEFDLAIADDSRALELDPRNGKAYNDRGMTYAAQGRYALALGEFEQAVSLNPADTAAADNLKSVRSLLARRAAETPSAPPQGAIPEAPPPRPGPPTLLAVAPSPMDAAVSPASPSAPPPRMVRPVLEAVAPVIPPDRFCTAAERNDFLDQVYKPAQATANRNVERANAYRVHLNRLFNEHVKGFYDGGKYIGAIKDEIDAYTPIADEAFHLGMALTEQYSALMAVPVGGC